MRKLDVIGEGMKFGEWTILRMLEYPYFLCRCSCGSEHSVNGFHLDLGNTTQCNSCRKIKPRVDLTDKRVGNLQILSYIGLYKGSRGAIHPHWKCQCILCGETVNVRSDHLSSYGEKIYKNKSCGCNRRGQNNYGWKGYKEISGQYWKQIQKSANERNISFQLKIEDAWNLYEQQNRVCALSGIPLVMHTSGNHQGTASLDRIDSAGDYILDNIQWVHKHINQMKLDHCQEYFIELCNKVSNYNFSSYRQF